jgi:hypothetical protein
LPLLVPVERFGNGADVGFFDRIAALGGSGQKQNLFLDVGGEVVEPHDLRHACRRDLAEVGELGLVGIAARGDVGVLYGTDGGGRTVLRAYYANKDTSVVEDVPSEARLAPARWTTVEVGR